MPPRLPARVLPSTNNLSSSLAALQLSTSSSSGASRCLLPQRASLPIPTLSIVGRQRPGNVTQIACLHSSPNLNSRRAKKPPSNPWSVAKAAEKRDKVRLRKEEIHKARREAASDPVVGHTTPFLEAMDAKPETPIPMDQMIAGAATTERYAKFEKAILEEPLSRLNHFLQPEEVTESMARSKELEESPIGRGTEKELANAKDFHLKATASMNRILSLGNGSSMDKTRANKVWCIGTFGRHVTDQMFPEAKHPSTTSNPESDPVKTPRVGADTGSSEVQAALLTMKIRSLAKQLETNTHDKMNKRNLRLMVHKRQKLLKYLKRKERGGKRYRYVMESLGLDDNAIMKEVFM